MDLRRKGIAQPLKKGGRVYRVIPRSEKGPGELPGELKKLLPTMQRKGYLKNEDVRKILGITVAQAYRLLRRLTESGFLSYKGTKRGRCYFLTRNNEQSQIDIKHPHNDAVDNEGVQ